MLQYTQDKYACVGFNISGSSYREPVESVFPVVNIAGDTVVFFKSKMFLNSRLIYCTHCSKSTTVSLFISTVTNYSINPTCTTEMSSTVLTMS